MIKKLAQLVKDKRNELDDTNTKVQQSLVSIPMHSIREYENSAIKLNAEIQMLLPIINQLSLIYQEVISEMRVIQGDVIVSRITSNEANIVDENEHSISYIKNMMFNEGKFQSYKRILELLEK